MKKIPVIMVAAFFLVSLTGCETVKDWTAKTTNWEIGVAQKVLGKGDAEKPKEAKEEPKEKPEEKIKKERSESKDDGIVGWTKRTTEWEMREADKVISDKRSSSEEKRATEPKPNGSICSLKGGCSTANVRSGPSTKASIVGKMRRDDSAEVISEKPGWLNIKLKSGNKGWVSKSLVEYTAP